MRLGAFEINEPLPELHEPHVIAVLRPWINVGRVGTLALSRLEQHFGAKDLGQLARPGAFYDFTRYRPRTRFVNGKRVLNIPNTFPQVRPASGRQRPPLPPHARTPLLGRRLLRVHH